ncbi:MAG: hypothetical protein EOO75_17960 [Myxococcales bacterium]|nr:MAG: hypothetical protein EOO75_17960 [Myxococcales bacterium]
MVKPPEPRFAPAAGVPGLRALHTERGGVWSWVVRPGVYATEVWGHLSVEMAEQIVSHSAPVVRAYRMDSFNCWFEMTGYDSEARAALTRAARENRNPGHLHIGTRSKLVAMGVSVANLVLGGRIHHHATMPELRAALEAAPRRSSP